MKLSTNIILALSCVGHALAWNHATAAELREGLRSQDRALVACKRLSEPRSEGCMLTPL